MIAIELGPQHIAALVAAGALREADRADPAAVAAAIRRLLAGLAPRLARPSALASIIRNGGKPERDET